MKKIITVLILIAITINVSNAQNFYAGLGGSLNFASHAGIMSDNYEVNYNVAFEYLKEEHTISRTSLGKGYMGNISIGYSTSRQINFELNCSYLIGFSSAYSNIVNYATGQEKETRKIKMNSLLLNPSIVFVKQIKQADLYMACGPAFDFSRATDNYDYSLSVKDKNNYTEHFTAEYESNVKIGANIRLGIQKTINYNLQVYSELSLNYMTFSPDKRTITAYEVNGHDSIGKLNTSQLQAEFSDKYNKYFKYENDEWIETWNENEPRKLKKFDIPASFGSLSVGIRYIFYRRKTDQQIR